MIATEIVDCLDGTFSTRAAMVHNPEVGPFIIQGWRHNGPASVLIQYNPGGTTDIEYFDYNPAMTPQEGITQRRERITHWHTVENPDYSYEKD